MDQNEFREESPIPTLPGTKTIFEMSELYDVSVDALRFYEEKGLLFPRFIGSKHFYSSTDEIRLQLIQKGEGLGFSLADIIRLLFSDASK